MATYTRASNKLTTPSDSKRRTLGLLEIRPAHKIITLLHGMGGHDSSQNHHSAALHGGA
jgi:hypothetical protein